MPLKATWWLVTRRPEAETKEAVPPPKRTMASLRDEPFAL